MHLQNGDGTKKNKQKKCKMKKFSQFLNEIEVVRTIGCVVQRPPAVVHWQSAVRGRGYRSGRGR